MLRGRALQPPLEIFLANTRQRCVLALVLEWQVYPDGEQLAMAKGYVESVCDDGNGHEEESQDGDVFTGGYDRTRVFVKVYMPVSVLLPTSLDRS